MNSQSKRLLDLLFHEIRSDWAAYSNVFWTRFSLCKKWSNSPYNSRSAIAKITIRKHWEFPSQVLVSFTFLTSGEAFGLHIVTFSERDFRFAKKWVTLPITQDGRSRKSRSGNTGNSPLKCSSLLPFLQTGHSLSGQRPTQLNAKNGSQKSE